MTIWVWDKDKALAVRLKDVERTIVCPRCKGSGETYELIDGRVEILTCVYCRGQRSVFEDDYGTIITCPKCAGKGQIRDGGFTCHFCYGYGNVYLEQYAAEVLSK